MARDSSSNLAKKLILSWQREKNAQRQLARATTDLAHKERELLEARASAKNHGVSGVFCLDDVYYEITADVEVRKFEVRKLETRNGGTVAA